MLTYVTYKSTIGNMAEQEEMWEPVDTAPNGVLVNTKIDDEHGCRNIQPLLRQGNLWFTSERPGAMYVYYAPTHWRPIPLGAENL